MKLKPGTAREYVRTHDAIWPELVDLLKHSGLSDYSIYLDQDGSTLFAAVTESGPDCQGLLEANPVMRRWWLAMAPLMEMDDDGRPRTEPVELVFRLD